MPAQIVDVGSFEMLSNRNYQAGTYPFVAVELRARVGRVLLQVDRTAWSAFEATNVATIELIVEYSQNGQDPWRVVGGLKAQCAPAINPDGTPANFVSSDFAVPDVGITGRHLRGSMIMSNRTKRTSLMAVLKET